MQRSSIREDDSSIEYIESDPGTQSDIESELKIYNALSTNKKAHKYILKHKGKKCRENQSWNQQYCLMLQNTEAMRLSVVQEDGLLRINKINKIFLSLCKCVQFLHSLNVVHRNINIQNVLVDKQSNCKLINFKYALNLKEKQEDPLDFFEIQYPIAPEIGGISEIFKNNSDNSSEQQYFPIQPQPFKIDSYSLGVILFFLKSNSMKIDKISDHKIPKQQLAIIQGCLQRNVQKRWNIDQIIEEAKRLQLSTRSIGSRTDNTQSTIIESSSNYKIFVDYQPNLIIIKSQIPLQQHISGDCLNKTWNGDENRKMDISQQITFKSKKLIQNNFKKLTILFQLFLMNYKMLLKFQFSSLLKMVFKKINSLLIEFKMATSFSQYEQKRIQFVSKYKLLKSKVDQQIKEGFFSKIFTFLCNSNQIREKKIDSTEPRANNYISNQKQSPQQKLNSIIFCQFAKLSNKLKDYEHYKNNTILVFLTVVQYFQELTNFDTQFKDINKYFDEFLNNFVALKLGSIDKQTKIENNNLLFITIQNKLKDIYSKYSRSRPH